MIEVTWETVRLLRELRRVVQCLGLVSHAPSQAGNMAPPPDDLERPSRWRVSDRKAPVPHLGSHSPFAADSSIPRGSIDVKGDKTPEYRQKSHVYFQRRLDGMASAGRMFGESDLAALLAEAEETLEAWQKTPLVAGQRPAMQDPRWKQWVAVCDESVTDLVRWYGCSRSLIYQIRQNYRMETQ